MNRTTIGFLLIAAAAWIHFGGGSSVSSSPEEIPDRPSDALVALVEPVGAAVKGPQLKRRLAAFYRDLAGVVARDKGGVIASTITFRAVHGRALPLALNGVDVDPPPADLGDAINRAIGKHLDIIDADGLYRPVRLDGPTRAKLVEVLRALSWAFGS